MLNIAVGAPVWIVYTFIRFIYSICQELTRILLQTWRAVRPSQGLVRARLKAAAREPVGSFIKMYKQDLEAIERIPIEVL